MNGTAIFTKRLRKKKPMPSSLDGDRSRRPLTMTNRAMLGLAQEYTTFAIHHQAAGKVPGLWAIGEATCRKTTEVMANARSASA